MRKVSWHKPVDLLKFIVIKLSKGDGSIHSLVFIILHLFLVHFDKFKAEDSNFTVLCGGSSYLCN